MGGSSSKPASSGNTSSNTNNQKQLQECQEEKARCLESNKAYASDVEQYKKEKAALETKNKEYEGEITKLKNKLADAESIVNGYVALEEAAQSFSNLFIEFKSKRESFADSGINESFIGSLSTGSSVGVIIAIVLVIIGAGLVIWFLWRKKTVESRKADTSVLFDTRGP